jgi:protein-disulfide isomerase
MGDRLADHNDLSFSANLLVPHKPCGGGAHYNIPMKLLAVALAAAAALAAGSTDNTVGNTYGDPHAPVLIEIFSDFQCPACKTLHDEVFQSLMREFVVPGKVYIIYRYFPLAMHPFGRPCAEFACAAARIGRYQKVADALFAQQTSIAMSGKVEEVVDSVLTPTEARKVRSLLQDPGVQREIRTDLAEGNLVPVSGTPTLWVTRSGKSQVVNWPINYTLFKSYLDALLAKK